MNGFCRWMIAVVCGVLIGFAGSGVYAETWSDSTGNFKIEAEFIGVSGKSITLRKPDGTTIDVPIERLSAESRALAKRLYEAQRAEAAGTPAAPRPSGSPAPLRSASTQAQPAATPSPAQGANVLTASPPAVPVNFTPPQPAPLPPMPPFPENASLQETVDFVRSQMIAGHPQVLWYALPDEIRSTVDDPEIRGLLRPLTEDQLKESKPVNEVVMQVIEVLITKKNFVLNSQLMSDVPPLFAPLIRQAYDPVVGLLYELQMLSMATAWIHERSITEILNEHGPRIGSHIRALTTVVPLQTFGVVPEISANETSADTGQVTFTFADGRQEEQEMVRYAGRWIPKDLADLWIENKDDFKSKVQSNVDEFAETFGALHEQRQASMGFVQGFVERALAPLLAAMTQEEFDRGLQELTAVASMMMPNVPAAGF